MRVVANWRQKTIKFSSYSQTRNLATSTDQTPHKTFLNSDSHVKHLCNHKKFSEAIHILCQNKRLSEAIQLLYRIDRPSHTIYSTLLQHCLQQKALDLGKKVHQHVKNNVRFKAGVIIYNRLLELYCNCGCIDDARQLFDRMAQRNVYSWTFMVSGYVEVGDLRRARGVFDAMPERDYYSWNTMISGYVKAGDLRGARGLFDEMTERDVCSWTTMISGYVKAGDLRGARGVFDAMPERNVCSWNTMLSGYVKAGDLKGARRVFDAMPERDVYSWTTMLSGYARHDQPSDALELFRVMEKNGDLGRSKFVVSSALKACSAASCLRAGKEIHGHIVRMGLDLDEVEVWSSLLDMYRKCGSIDDARRIFDKSCAQTHHLANQNTPKTFLNCDSHVKHLCNVNKFSEAIHILCQNKRLSEAIQLLYRIDRPSHTIYSTLLQHCLQQKALDLGKKVHQHVKNNVRFKAGVIIYNRLLELYCKCGCIDDARKLFDRMAQRNVYSWTFMVSGYVEVGDLRRARGVFDAMPERDVCSWNTMLSGYVKAGDLKGARGVFDEMPERDNYSWNTMISGYVEAGDLRGLEGFNLLVELLSSGIRPDECTFSVVLNACANLCAEYLGKQVHGHMIRIGCDPNSFANNELIHMYSRLGNVEIAYRIFKGIPQPDLVSWTSLINGYAQNGQPHEALRLFELLLKSGIKPNHITLTVVLSACTRAGLVDEGLEYFHSIKEKHGLEYTENHYGCVIDLLGRSGRLKEAEDFILSMPMKPCKCDWASLLHSCKIHGNIELSKRSAEAFLQIEPDHPATYATLSNIYATAGKWNEVAKLRKVMNDKGVVNRPGISWIEIKGKVHTFMAGDTSHPYTTEIYDYLLELLRRMKEEGYNPETNYVVHDVEEEQKEQIISYHSEKLAVAFGIIATPRGTTIKIFKNLRTCVDCHTSFKYISKIVERKIIVRDQAQFHCFEGGSCSCKDYW